jgi:hypothetical protein
MLIAALAVVVFAVSQASAEDPELNNPQETNVPYINWIGGKLLVKKCFERSDLGPWTAEDTAGVFNWQNNFPAPYPSFLSGLAGPGDSAKVKPTIEDIGHKEHACYGVTVSSSVPSIHDLRLSVNSKYDDEEGGVVVAEHDFLVVFMRATQPTIDEIGTGEPGGAGVGDPAGDGAFRTPYLDAPGGTPLDTDALEDVYGLVKVNVKGTFPLAGFDADNTVTLPDDWAALAGKLASDKTSGVPGSTPMRWDIHDDQGNAAGQGHALDSTSLTDHVPTSGCDDLLYIGTVDAVDNCEGEWWADEDFGPFSSLLGLKLAMGPFDPLRPWTSLFPDGKLDAGDAPMPPLQMNVAITGEGDIGRLGRADKDEIYVTDPTKDGEYEHNLHAPFYSALIPAAGIPGDTDPKVGIQEFDDYFEGRSGVAGSFQNNNPGFEGSPLEEALWHEGVYDYWATFRKSWRGGEWQCKDPEGEPYQQPTGAKQVAVYTDEHGEAFVKFYPYSGIGGNAFPNGLPTGQNNFRCDISPGLYGTATIQATGIYPEKAPEAIPASATLTKNATHSANKSLKCARKAADEILCVETITDINGDPIDGAEVRFSTSGNEGHVDHDNIVWTGTDFTGAAVSWDTTGQVVTEEDDQNRFVVIETNAKGQAGIFIHDSRNLCLNVSSENVETDYENAELGISGTSIFRDFDVIVGGTATSGTCGLGHTGNGPATVPVPGPAPAVTPPPPPAPAPSGGTAGTQGSGTSGGTSAAASSAGTSVVVSLGGPVVPAAPAVQISTKPIVVNAVAAKLFSLKVMQTKKGRMLVVKVLGKQKKAKIKIMLLGKNGKVIGRFIRTVPTNKTFMISNLKLGKKALSVRASVLKA